MTNKEEPINPSAPTAKPEPTKPIRDREVDTRPKPAVPVSPPPVEVPNNTDEHDGSTDSTENMVDVAPETNDAIEVVEPPSIDNVAEATPNESKVDAQSVEDEATEPEIPSTPVLPVQPKEHTVIQW